MVRGHLKVEIPGEYICTKRPATTTSIFLASQDTQTQSRHKMSENVRLFRCSRLNFSTQPGWERTLASQNTPVMEDAFSKLSTFRLPPSPSLPPFLHLLSRGRARATAHPPSPAHPPSRKRAFCLVMSRFFRFVIWEASVIGMAGLIVNS